MVDFARQELYSDLYLFAARESGDEVTRLDITKRFPDGLWRTTAHGLAEGCGIRLNRPPLHPEPFYSCSPTNTAWFASTGLDGTFYSFLLTEDEWTDRSPVVVTCPGSFGDRWIAGSGLRDFLRLGRRVRYDVLPGLVAKAVAGDLESIGYLESHEFATWVRPADAAQLERLAAEFELEPLDNIADRLAEWQQLYASMVQHSAGSA